MSDPFIKVYPGILSRDYCRTVIDRFETDARRRPSTVGRLNQRQTPGRTGTTLDLHEDRTEWADVVQTTHAAVQKAVVSYAAGFPLLAALLTEGKLGCRYPRIERVDPGQSFDWHADAASAETAERVLACLLYLSDIGEGGQTDFMHQSVKIQPEAGTAVIFPPYWTHLHRGVTPTQDIKYTMSFFWFFLEPEAKAERSNLWQRITGRA